MKYTKIVLCALLLFSITSTSFAQDKPFRIGVKVGLPIIAGLSAEFVTPLLGEKLAIYGDFSTFSPTVEDIEVKMTYMEFGANYYLIKEGRGPYVSLGYSNFSSDFTFSGIESNDGTRQDGTATVDYGFSGLNLKLGAKLGGLFYFRPEIGYGLGTRSSDLNIVVRFPDGSTETQTEKVPNFFTSGLVGSISIGFAF